VKDGLGLRWSFLGSFETIELKCAWRHCGLLCALAPAVVNEVMEALVKLRGKVAMIGWNATPRPY
jgi:hypothetical protein